MNPRRSFVGAAGLAIACFAQSALAADPQPNPALDAGPVDRFGRLGRQQVQITAGTEDDSASIALEIANWRVSPTSATGEDAFLRVNDTLNVIVSTPLNGQDEAAPATLDGLANGTRLTLRWGRWIAFSPRTVPPDALTIYQSAQAECRRTAAELNGRRMSELGQQPLPAAVAAVEALNRADLSECDDPSGGSQNLIALHLPASERAYITAFIPADARQFGAEVSIGRNQFEYVDPATLVPSEERHIQWSASIFYSQYLRRSKTAVTASARYERSYEAADEATFCPANPNNVVITCTTAAGGAPTLNESLLLSLGLRHQFAHNGILRNLAIAPLVTYDVLDDVVGVDVPVYFIPNSEGGLTGGLRFGYRSDRENEFSVGIFIGAAFGLGN